jgi:hypothetical protein
VTTDTTNDNSLHFKEQFDLLSNNTKEYDSTVPFILKHIVNKLPQREHFIDIGAGRGNLAKPLSVYFSQTTIIEPNRRFYHELLDWSAERELNFKGVNGTWETAEVHKADCILMSHVLYYIPLKEWLSFIDKAYDGLHPGGSIIIILNKLANGVTDLYKYFLAPGEWREIASAESMLETLHLAGYHIEATDFPSFIYANTVQEAHELIDFLLLGRADLQTDTMRQLSLEYVESHLKKGNRYAINSDCMLITVRKPQ